MLGAKIRRFNRVSIIYVHWSHIKIATFLPLVTLHETWTRLLECQCLVESSYKQSYMTIFFSNFELKLQSDYHSSISHSIILLISTGDPNRGILI